MVFDVGRVLYQWNLRHLFARLIDDQAELDWFLAHVVNEDWHGQHDAGRALDDMVAERSSAFPEHAALIAAYRTRFADTIPGPIDGTHTLVRRLAAAGVPLFGLTNFGAEFWDEFRPGEDLFDLFDEIVVSGRELCVKPDPRIYALAEARFGREPADLLFVDDKPENVAAAIARGWQGHVFTDARALEAELVARDLLAAGCRC